MNIDDYIKSVDPKTVASGYGTAYELIKDYDKYIDEMNLSYLAYSDKLPDISHGYVCYWTCTDTQVGYGLYYFRHKPICITRQLCRKCKTDLFWLKEFYQKEVFNYVLTKFLSNIEFENNGKIIDNETIDLKDFQGYSLKPGYNGIV